MEIESKFGFEISVVMRVRVVMIVEYDHGLELMFSWLNV